MLVLMFRYGLDMKSFWSADKFLMKAVILSVIAQSRSMRIPWRWSERKGEGEGERRV
jgi:hypothetical protein